MTAVEYKKWRARHIKTLNYEYVPIRKIYTDGRSIEVIDLSDCGDDIWYAEIKQDWSTGQSFAVLRDKDFNPVVNE